MIHIAHCIASIQLQFSSIHFIARIELVYIWQNLVHFLNEIDSLPDFLFKTEPFVRLVDLLTSRYTNA